ncbi:MAG: hypothetical protein QXU18_04685 [Thermoplasmatales archaeon]
MWNNRKKLFLLLSIMVLLMPVILMAPVSVSQPHSVPAASVNVIPASSVSSLDMVSLGGIYGFFSGIGNDISQGASALYNDTIGQLVSFFGFGGSSPSGLEITVIDTEAAIFTVLGTVSSSIGTFFTSVFGFAAIEAMNPSLGIFGVVIALLLLIAIAVGVVIGIRLIVDIA